MKKIIFIFAILVLLSGCQMTNWWNNLFNHQVDLVSVAPQQEVAPSPAQEEEPQAEGALYWPYVNQKYNYELKYPVESWQVNKAELKAVEINYWGENEEDKVRREPLARLTIIVSKTDWPDLDQYVKKEKNKKEVQVEDLPEINGQKFVKIKVTASDQTSFQKYETIYNQLLYTLILSPYPLESDGVTPYFTQMIQSFKFLSLDNTEENNKTGPLKM